jgi:CMP-N-acetylneuraminic acid synthetase
MRKNLQRDFRDILGEFDKLTAGQGSTLSTPEEFQRASLRLREIAALLDDTQGSSPLLTESDVKQLMDRFQTTTMQA